MLADQDLMKVQDVTSRLEQPVTVILDRGFDVGDFQANLAGVAVQIGGVSMDRVRIEEDAASPFAGKPSLTFGPNRNIHYLAAPEGTELAPFLDALLWVGGASPVPAKDALAPLSASGNGYQALVFIAAACPHCPATVRTFLNAAAVLPNLTLVVIDALHFTDLSEKFKIKATPTVIINEGFTGVGEMKMDALIGHLKAADGAAALTSTLDSMIKNGRAEEAAELLCGHGRPEAILPIYLAPEFSTRMGALYAMEEALARDARIFDTIVGELIPLLSHQDAPLRGDTAELLGKIGHKAAVPALQQLESDTDPDVSEAATEALQAIAARIGS